MDWPSHIDYQKWWRTGRMVWRFSIWGFRTWGIGFRLCLWEPDINVHIGPFSIGLDGYPDDAA